MVIELVPIKTEEERFKKEKKALEQSMKIVDVVDDASKKQTELKEDLYVVNDAIETQAALGPFDAIEVL